MVSDIIIYFYLKALPQKRTEEREKAGDREPRIWKRRAQRAPMRIKDPYEPDKASRSLIPSVNGPGLHSSLSFLGACLKTGLRNSVGQVRCLGVLRSHCPIADGSCVGPWRGHICSPNAQNRDEVPLSYPMVWILSNFPWTPSLDVPLSSVTAKLLLAFLFRPYLEELFLAPYIMSAFLPLIGSPFGTLPLSITLYSNHSMKPRIMGVVFPSTPFPLHPRLLSRIQLTSLGEAREHFGYNHRLQS